MTLKKICNIPVIIGVLALGIQSLDQLLSPLMPPAGNAGFSWICFQAWAVYFFSGLNLKGGVKAFISYGLGVIVSISIMILGGWFTPLLGFFAFFSGRNNDLLSYLFRTKRVDLFNTGIIYWSRCFFCIYELYTWSYIW
ncbi:MAG: DUF1097 domain-containing protein [Parabacteroides sp.]|jgi:uncharacterized membrane protein|nr:DUF1097 domain-containing protein [Parabacteroides sp.]